jgi:hypothetical protein
MSGLRFKSSKKLPADSPYRRLVAEQRKLLAQ